jgi:hypothetical protein
MSTTIETGPMQDDLSLLINNQSNRPPFQAPHGMSAKTYIAGTAQQVTDGDADFEAGADLIIEVQASPGLRYASFTGLNGAAVTYTKAALASGNLGYKLTLTAPAASVRSFILFDI